MGKKTAPLLPASELLLRRLGERLRLARLRRRLTAKQVAERSGMAPMTLRSLERGGAGVTMGAYLAVMQVLGVEQDLELLARLDPVGRELQDAGLAQRRGPRASATTKPKAAIESPSSPRQLEPVPVLVPSPARRRRGTTGRAGAKNAAVPRKRAAAATGVSVADRKRWIEKSGFENSETLAALIEPAGSTPKRKR